MVILQQDEVLNELSKVNDGDNGLLVGRDELHNRINQNGESVNILHVNIRSVHKNIDNLILLLENFRLANSVDIIVLSECFRLLANDQPYIPGFDTFYNNANYNRNDGVMLLVRSGINVDFSHYRLPNSGATVGRLTFKVNDITFGMNSVYKPPPIPKQEFINDLHTYLELNQPMNLEIFIGDTNIDILKLEDDDVNDYLSTMAQQGFVSYVNSITRPDSNTCLDHIFVSQKLKSGKLGLSSFILDSHVTDHYPTMLNVRFDSKICNSMASGVITKTKLDVDGFRALLRSQDWSCVLGVQSTEVAASTFIDVYRNLMKETETEHVIRIRQHRKLKNWVTGGIITSIKNRDKMKKKLLRNYSVELENRYKTYRNYLTKLVHIQKTDTIKTKLIATKTT